MPLPLLLKLRALPWRWIGIGAAVLVVLWQLHAWGNRREAEGRADEIAKYEAAEAKATVEHNALIAEINEDHHAASKDLEGRLQAALARPPAVRVVRVQNGTACPAPVTADAGEPATADPGSGPAGEGETDYLVFRNEVLRLGADAEKFRQMALDAQKGWPK